MIVKYIASNVRPIDNLHQIFVHDGFVPMMEKMNTAAKDSGIVVFVTSSFRATSVVPGAIVPPAHKSNHLVGHGIDVNFLRGSVWYDSGAIMKDEGLIKDFIIQLESLGFRWGGRFNPCDPVHFDDGMNVNHPEEWDRLYKELHSAI